MSDSLMVYRVYYIDSKGADISYVTFIDSEEAEDYMLAHKDKFNVEVRYENSRYRF